jgi:drug/metabolite transporter (DMT)-like permease
VRSPMELRAGAASVKRRTGQPIALPRWTLHPSLSGFGWAALSVTVFSGWFVVTRFSVTHELRVWDVMALRFGGGALVLLPVLFRRAPRLPGRAWLEGLLFAALWGAPFVFFVALGLQSTSAAQASAITPALMPVFAGLIGWLALREPPGGLRLLGYLAIVGGLAALVISNASSNGRPNLGGIASLILAAAMWGIYTLRFRRSGLTPLQAAALVCFWSALFYLPPYLLFGLSHLVSASVQELTFQVVYQGFLMSVVAVVAFNRAATLLGAGAAGAIIALLPVIVAALAVPVLREIPSGGGAIAIGAIAVGVLLAARPAPSQNFLKHTPPQEKCRDPLLFPPDPQPSQGRVVPRGDRPPL